MQIGDRVLVVDRRLLTSMILDGQPVPSADVVRAVYWKLFAVMCFPEDLEAQERYRHAMVNEVLCQLPKDDCDAVRLANPEHLSFIAGLADQKIFAANILEETVRSRKNVFLGTPPSRGALSGQILCRLLDPAIGSLDHAYAAVIARFQHDQDFADEFCRRFFPGASLSVPSVSTLRAIWGDYRTVAHFWAADWVTRDHMMAITPDEAPKLLYHFLGVSGFFRRKLLNAKNPSTKTLYITSRSTSWRVVDENRKPFPPIKLELA